MIISFRTALDASSRIGRRQGTINREEFKAIQAALPDTKPDCACADCEAVSIQAAVDSGHLTAEQAANPKTINWAGLLAFIQALLPLILAIINGITPVPPAPTPSLPSGSGG